MEKAQGGTWATGHADTDRLLKHRLKSEVLVEFAGMQAMVFMNRGRFRRRRR